MDVYECVSTKLDVRQFSPEKVPSTIKLKILEAARLTQSGNNSQHWRFILVQDPQNLKTLGKNSSWGKWVERASFAVIVLTDPKLSYHMIDAGRAVQDMQLTAWSFGIASGVFTGLNDKDTRKDFNLPDHLNPTIVVGFGFPAGRLIGKKNRRALPELVFIEKYGGKFREEKLF